MQELKQKISDKTIEKIFSIEDIENEKKNFDVITYLLKPLIFPIIIAIGIFGVISISNAIQAKKTIKTENAVFDKIDTLNTNFSENALIFNPAIKYYSSKTDEYMNKPYDSIEQITLEKQLIQLYQIDSLSPMQEILLKKQLKLLSEKRQNWGKTENHFAYLSFTLFF